MHGCGVMYVAAWYWLGQLSPGGAKHSVTCSGPPAALVEASAHPASPSPPPAPPPTPGSRDPPAPPAPAPLAPSMITLPQHATTSATLRSPQGRRAGGRGGAPKKGVLSGPSTGLRGAKVDADRQAGLLRGTRRAGRRRDLRDLSELDLLHPRGQRGLARLERERMNDRRRGRLRRRHGGGSRPRRGRGWALGGRLGGRGDEHRRGRGDGLCRSRGSREGDGMAEGVGEAAAEAEVAGLAPRSSAMRSRSRKTQTPRVPRSTMAITRSNARRAEARRWSTKPAGRIPGAPAPTGGSGRTGAVDSPGGTRPERSGALSSRHHREHPARPAREPLLGDGAAHQVVLDARGDGPRGQRGAHVADPRPARADLLCQTVGDDAGERRRRRRRAR